MIRLNNELQIVLGMKSPEKSKLWLNELKQEAFAKEGNVVTTHTCKSAISKKQKAIKEKTNSRNSTPKQQRIFSPYLNSCPHLKQ